MNSKGNHSKKYTQKTITISKKNIMNTISLNEQIKNTRKVINLTQSAFAKKLGVSRALIILIETGKQNPTDDLLEKIYTEFNVAIRSNDVINLENKFKNKVEGLGGLPNGRTKQRIFNAMRSGGYTQKDSAQFAGVNEKTAGVYEKIRKESVQFQISENEELISILKKRADDSETTATDLVTITWRLEGLFKKREHLKGLI